MVLLALIGGLIYYMTLTADNGLIFDNVYAAGVNLGGMTPEEAKNVLHLSTDHTYKQENMVIELPDQQLQLTPADTKVSLDVDAAVDAAYNYGRTGSRYQQYLARQDAVLSSHTIDLVPYLNLDTDYIQNFINETVVPYNTALTQPMVTITGDRPALEAGQIDENVVHQVLTLTTGIPESSLDAAQLYGQIVDAYSENKFLVTIEVPTTEPESLNLEQIFQEYCVEPIDAVLNETDYSVIPEVYGYGFDIAAVQALLDAAAPGQTLEIQLEYLVPELTKEEIEGTLFQDVLGTYKASQSSSSNRATNLALASAAVNGVIVKPGETFSFNETVGKRTEEKGYKPAGAYVNGQSVNEVGGGICQVSSSLYYCALLADLEIVERTCHIYPSSYVPIGLDATVSWGYLDFKFRNNTDYPIRIEASAKGGTVNVTFYGTDDKSYYVKLESEILEKHDPATIYKTMPENNEAGYKDGDVIQSAHTGYKAVSYRCKYDKETNKLISKEKEANSSYKKTDKIICKIEVPETTPPVTTEPEPTEPEPTQPDPTEATDPGLEGEVGSGGGG